MPLTLPPTCITSTGGTLSVTVLRDIANVPSRGRSANQDPLPGDLRHDLIERSVRVIAVGKAARPQSLELLAACGWSFDVLAVRPGKEPIILRTGGAELPVLLHDGDDLDAAHGLLLASKAALRGGWSVCCTSDRLRLVPPASHDEGPDGALTIDVNAIAAARLDDALIIAMILDPRTLDPEHGSLIDQLVVEGQRRLAELLEAQAEKYRATVGQLAAEVRIGDTAATVRNLGRVTLALLAHLSVAARELRAVDPLQSLVLPETWAEARDLLHEACAASPDAEGMVRATQGLLDGVELDWCYATDFTDAVFRRLLELTLRVDLTADSPHRLPVDLANITSFEIGSLHESLLALVLTVDSSGSPRHDEDFESERKAGGVFYTPIPLVSEVLRYALDPVLEQRIATSSDRSASVKALTVCDPSCGSGNFLLPVAQRLTVAAFEHVVDIASYRRTLAEIVQNCIYGADCDDFAVRLARLGLRLLCDPTGRVTPPLAENFAIGDSLVGAWQESISMVPDPALDRVATHAPASVKEWRRVTQQRTDGQVSLFDVPAAPGLPVMGYRQETADAWGDLWFTPVEAGADPLSRFASLEEGGSPVRPRGPREYVHWPLAFPKIGDEPPLFDVVVGNPPYLRGRDHAQLDPEGRYFIAANYPACQGGQWNLYVPFILLAARLARERSCMLVQSSVLGSQYAAALHAELLANQGVAACLDFSSVANLFPSAAVQVAALVLTSSAVSEARFVRYADALAVASAVSVSESELRGLPLGYWTLPTSSLDLDEREVFTSAELRLGDVAFIQDGMEQSAAYEVQRHVRESTGVPGELHLTPTGLIDPFRSLWGSKPVKYLGMRFDRPVLDAERLRAEGFAKMADQGESEKIAIAGLSTRIEAVVDVGASLISKSAFVVRFTDEEICPYAVAAILNSSVTNRIYDAAFGAIGFGAGSRNYRPPTLGALPLPAKALLSRHASGNPSRSTLLSFLGKRLHEQDFGGADREAVLAESESAVKEALCASRRATS